MIASKAKYICNLCDFVSTGNKGDPQILSVFEQFSYANCYIDRIATQKPPPGSIQIKGDGQKNRYIVNMFVQFYPGPSKYPNDNISKRLDWFRSSLSKLADAIDLNSLTFPPSITKQDGYLNVIDDFRKQYFLKYQQSLIIDDYNGTLLPLDSNSQGTHYAEPLKILRTIEVQNIDDLEPHPQIKIKVRQHIELDKLIYVTKILSKSPSSLEQTVPSGNPPKLKIGVKKTLTSEHQIIDQLPLYEKNPTWKKKISELVQDLDPSWDIIFKHPDVINHLTKLDQIFGEEMKSFGDFIEILPIPQDNIFNAFRHCHYPPKVIIVGQDVYADQLNQAMGLSFSVPDGVAIPPSLVNIFKELSTDIEGFKTPSSGNLTHWAQQDILLLNCALTVRYQQKTSHVKYWKPLTDTIIHLLSKASTPIVFMLWGNFAKDKKSLIQDPSKHLILEATHPSPLGARQGGWFGSRHFSQCNQFLQQHQICPINW